MKRLPRLSLLAALSLLASLALAAPTKFSGSFYCQPRQTFIFADVPNVGKVPVTLKLVIPGAGYVSNMLGSVTCFTDDQTIDLQTGAGTATYTLRDATGDTIVMKLEAQNAPPTAGSLHSVTYSGTFQVTAGTGRFSGACGAGTFSGWNDDDPPATAGGLPSTSLGYWEFSGSLDTGNGADAMPLQISSRAQVGSGANVGILGFQFCGTASRSFLIRGVGPALTQFGVAGAVTNPVLSVVNGKGAVVATNDDWSDQGTSAASGASLALIAARVGAFALPAGSKDAALFVTLAPGTYTVSLAGVGSATGIGLIEVYEVR